MRTYRGRCLTRRGSRSSPMRSGGAGPSRAGHPQYQAGLDWCNDARTGMPPGIPGGAMCVQRFDDSLDSAIHITYRISLRSSSMPEPRDPLLKVLIYCLFYSEGMVESMVLVCSAAGRARGPGPRRGITFSTTGWWGVGALGTPISLMIPPQVHLRRPCYDFYFL